MSHASNVCGTVLDAEEVGKICKEKGVFFALDAAQSAGVINIDFCLLYTSMQKKDSAINIDKSIDFSTQK